MDENFLRFKIDSLNEEKRLEEIGNSQSHIAISRAETKEPEAIFALEKETSDIEQPNMNIEHLEAAIDVTPERNGGVKKQILLPGTGPNTLCYGDRVHICYSGYYRVGNVLKSFTNDSEKFHFNLGKGAVVPGLDIGITTMKMNEQALFIIQPEYGYGSAGYPPIIPPYTILFYNVIMLDWKLEDLSPKKDNGILRKTILKGEGVAFPNDGASVKMEIIGYFEEMKFEHKEIEFILGEGCEVGIPEGIEISLLRFKLNEKSVLHLKSPYAFGTAGHEEFKIPSEADVRYEITLLSFQKAKDVWEMNSDEKLQKSIEAKGKGLKYFKEDKVKSAIKQFKKIVCCLENEPGVSSDSQQERKCLLLSGYLNLALCYKKVQQYIESIKVCEKALALDPKNEKAMFRRAQCRMKIKDFKEALQDFISVLNINADNKFCKKYILHCKAEIKQQRERDRRIYNDMFKKFQDQDEEERKKRNSDMETGTWDERLSVHRTGETFFLHI